jgi:hypothetical protein
MIETEITNLLGKEQNMSKLLGPDENMLFTLSDLRNEILGRKVCHKALPRMLTYHSERHVPCPARDP